MKPAIPKGTRDFLPDQVIKRKFIFGIIEEVFKKYGYLPIETPAMELLSTLTGKYGEEGDRLLFKVLNNGDFLSKANAQALEKRDSTGLIPSISKRGLRYDLTVPFARYVVMHRNDLHLPFKRYQIQPVWRADRPQKGRYQEFYQCDVDVVGSRSLMYEAELIHIFDEVFAQLKMDVVIKLNNRKILYGLAEANNITDQFMDMTIAIDKLDKIGAEGVIKEMVKKGISEETAGNILSLLEIKDLDQLEEAFANSETGRKGIEEIRQVYNYIDKDTVSNTLEFDITLARGLNYYTGCIVEVAADTNSYPDLVMGSIGGGGRYDDLTSVFGLKDVSGVGISFGAARIYDVMKEMSLFPEGIEEAVKIIFVSFDNASHHYAYNQAMKLRKAGIASDIYPEPVKLNKQMKYANMRGIPYVALVGEEEMQTGMITCKNMQSGEQEKITIADMIKRWAK